MKIVQIKEIEDCFDGSFMKEILLDSVITKKIIDYLGQEGQLYYFPTFSRPFFRIDVPGKYIIKGIEGNKTARVILERENLNQSLNHLKNIVKQYQ